MNDLEARVRRAVAAEPVVDMHTHLYPPSFGTPFAGAGDAADASGLMLWGVDELLTYHYLVAEVFRVVPTRVLPYEAYWKLTKRQQADHIFKHLFVERAPISEACRGVLTTLQQLGLDPGDATPDRWRAFCAAQHPSDYVDRVMNAANVRSITMTNNVFDPNEHARWLRDPNALRDARFRPVLRIDPLVNDWPAACRSLAEWGYATDAEAGPATLAEVRRFLHDWLDRTGAIYVAMSLPPAFVYPSGNDGPQRVLEEAVLAVCVERDLPLALMIGAIRGANPLLRDAADVGGLADVGSVVNLCRTFPANRFFVTMLARQNQHDLAVAARKFGNLMPFGCWWFLNIPSLIEEITTLRVELLGTSFIPQHSDARVIDQLIYKWDHSRQVIGTVLARAFEQQATAGRPVTDAQIAATVRQFFSGNFEAVLSGE